MATPLLQIAPACPSCRADLEPHIEEVRDPIGGELFAIERCPRCGMGVTLPAPRRIEAYYRDRYYGDRHSFTNRLCNWRRRRLVARHLTPAPGLRLLDVGSGDGQFLDSATRAGWESVGVEPHASSSAGRYKVFRALEQASALAPYSCVTVWHVLEHVPAPLDCLIKLRSLMSEKSVLLLAVPDFGGSQAQIFGRHWLHLDVPRHLFHFTAVSLTQLLEDAGFDVLRTAHQEVEYDLFGWIQSSINAVSTTPNVLFDSLTGKPRRVGFLQVAASYVAACLLSAIALGLTVGSTLAGRGGTLIVAARPRVRR